MARERLGPEARIVGVDVAPAMLAVARTVDPTIDWREGNAVSLPVSAGEHFTVLTCHQGLQFMPDKPAAIREMRRVLAPGGRIAIATWRSLEDIPGMRDLNEVAERHVGRIVDSRHAFGDATELSNLLIDAGFGDVNVQTLAHDVQFADGALFARLNAMAVIGMSEKGKTMSEAERGELAGRIAADSEHAIAKATKNGTFVLPLDNQHCYSRRLTRAGSIADRACPSAPALPAGRSACVTPSGRQQCRNAPPRRPDRYASGWRDTPGSRESGESPLRSGNG